jgi:hypothetical protein
MLATPRTTWARERRAQADAASQAQGAWALTGTDRLTESALRLDKSHCGLAD